MRIAVVHSYYSSRQPSGENVVVDLQIEALTHAGHEVLRIARHTDRGEQQRSYPLRSAVRVAAGWGDNPLAELETWRPDVVHVHNLFPNLTRRWVKASPAPVVHTLHNYRPLCPGGTLFRDGAACTLCPDSGRAWPAVVHRCFHDSALATLPVALGTSFARDPLLTEAARVIALHEPMADTFVRYGVARAKVTVVPNFAPDRPLQREPSSEVFLYAGRLSAEKGIAELVRAWPRGRRLIVAGSGPLQAELVSLARPDVEFVGLLDSAELHRVMDSAVGLIVPSLWPEGLPTVYLEALRSGLPVLASSTCVVGRLVIEQGTGALLTGDLEADLAAAVVSFSGLTRRCRQMFEERYQRTAWLDRIQTIYRDVVRTR